MLLGHGDEVGEHRGLDPVVAVDEVDELAAGAVEREVASGGGALVLGVDDVDADVALGHAVGHLAGAVLGAVIDHEQLEVPHGLVLQALDGSADKTVNVIGRNDD